MGSYLNPGNGLFSRSLHSTIYVDKSGLIQQMNELINTEQRYVCVSRPRRFGKSMGLNMLAAYYGRGVDSAPMFDALAIGHSEAYRTHLNQYNVIRINMQEFLSMTKSVNEMIDLLKKRLVRELKSAYPEHVMEENLIFAMQDIYTETGRAFILLIDEWDCLFREYQNDTVSQKKYLDFLRLWLKDQEYIALAYMTGILPIKKYGTHSALNMFSEYSMTEPGRLAPYFGFTEDEVQTLCETYDMSFEEARSWYDGYQLSCRERGRTKVYSLYSPKSVVDSMLNGFFNSYWNRTETYEALKIYIQMNMDGLKDAVVAMLGGESVPVNTGSFTNDMTTFASKDDVLTLLVHLGYLTYHWTEKTVSIPNKEVAEEYITAIRTMEWGEVTRAVEHSKKLLLALWDLDGDTVARGIEQAHNEISILKYHDENALSCTIHLAFYYAREYYNIIRELPAGKGFADICFIPRKLHADKPAVIIELKWDQSADGAIAQIRQRNYAGALKEYQGNLLLAGINYDRKTKKHTCLIERWKMQTIKI